MRCARDSTITLVRVFSLFLATAVLGGLAGRTAVADSPPPTAEKGYLLQPGDMLQVTVWREPDLTAEVLIRSDGGLSFPLVGEVRAAGKTVEALSEEFAKRLKKYVPDPVVTIAAKGFGGNQIYVIGKVQHPGGFGFVKPLDVMAALSLAGGGTSFASLNHILILRRENGQQRAIRFHYTEVASGKDLAENILLQSGDTVVVP